VSGADRIEARGGGGMEGDTTVVVWDGAVLELFHETGSARFHASMIDSFELADSPGPTGEALKVQSMRTGTMLPTRFVGEERAKLERIVTQVRAFR
jgi:hypothetical protein